MNKKIKQFTTMMQAEAKKCGLKFVDGPDNKAVPAPDANIGMTNGVERCVFLVGLAEI